MKVAVAATIAIRCEVAVRFNGVPPEILSQSSKPVSEVGTETTRPITSASAHPWAAASSAIPSAESTAAIVAKV